MPSEHEPPKPLPDSGSISFADNFNSIEGEGQISIFINDGEGNFSFKDYLKSDAETYLEIPYIVTIRFADIDNDGNYDLFTGVYEVNTLISINT
ncbi:VCBS repeat-containing protein [Marinilabiliaceae bacterium ANBcel2]|nr:VCBS repeat-containing protein [Marinilabiliaceae bacterium ANBcel2]